MLHALGLSSVFSTLILAEDLPRSKPDPLPYQTALERLQVSASEALVFEDSPAGMRAAIAAGIPTVAIASTHPPSTLIALGATLVISDFTDRHLHRLLQTALTPAYSLA
jgi:beta-phosphoglucomutase-like phosphatase (HAD superfamily)